MRASVKRPPVCHARARTHVFRRVLEEACSAALVLHRVHGHHLETTPTDRENEGIVGFQDLKTIGHTHEHTAAQCQRTATRERSWQHDRSQPRAHMRIELRCADLLVPTVLLQSDLHVAEVIL